VLRARNLGEADKIFTLFTRLRGKVDAVGKGVRRTKSHVGGRLEFLSEATLTLHRGRNLDVITSAQTRTTHWNGVVEPGAFATGHLLAELVDSFCEPDLAMPEIYELLASAIAAIDGSGDPAKFVPRFELRLLHALGLAPPDDSCVRCGGALGGEAWIDADAHGLACHACLGARGAALALDADDVANFRALGRPRGDAGAATLATPRTARAIDDLLSVHLGKRPRASVHLERYSV